MAKFKKLAMLCTALLATATLAAGCEIPFGNIFSSEDNSNNTESSVEVSSEEASESSEEASSEEVSSETSEDIGGGETEAAYYELIVDGASASLTCESAWTNVYGEITFTAPEAGTYGIYAVDANFAEAGVYFSQGDEEGSTKYIFDVAEAGDVTLTTNYFFMDTNPLEFDYYVYKLDTLTVSEAEGTAALCANLPVPVKVVAPAAGTYELRLTSEVVWANDMADLAAGGESASKRSFDFTEAGEEISFYVMYNNMNVEKFNFEWTFGEKVIQALAVGENEVTYEKGNTEFSFVSETSATYEISVDTAYGLLITTNDAWASTCILTVEAGVPVTVTVYFSGWDANYDNSYDSVKATLTISAFVEDDPSALALGDNTFTTTADGVVASFTAEVSGTYSFYDNSYSDSIYAEGSEEGTTNLEVYIAAGESVSFTVKYDGLFTLSVEKLPDIVNLYVGETTVTVPAGDNQLQINADNGEYILTWDNENVIVYDSGFPYEAGSILYVSWYSEFTIGTVDGSEIADVTFNLAAYEYPTVSLGDNTISVGTEATTYKFTAEQIGCYTFTLVGEKINYVTLNADDAIDYPDALEAAGVISINVRAGAEISLAVTAEEACEISVNVACTSTIASFEASVTMDEETMAPVSLTIPSIAAGECIYFQATRMVGDYILSWDGSMSIVVYAGENVGISYDPQVRLTRTMMDGFVYIIVRNSSYDGTNYENVVLNIAPYEEPAAPTMVGNHDVEVTDAWAGATLTLTASEAGTYTISFAEGETNGDLGLEDAYGFETIEMPYTFTLAAGESITFIVLTLNWSADTINLVVTQAE